MKNREIVIFFFLFSFLSFFKVRIQCQTFHPVSHATHGIYSSSFDKISPHDLRSSIKDTFHTFITKNMKNLVGRMNVKLGERFSSQLHSKLKTEYEESVEEQIQALRQQAKNKKQLSERIKESNDKLLREINNDENNLQNKNNSNEKIKKILKHNLDQIKYLNGRVKYLTDKANHLEKHLEEMKKENKEETSFVCNIQKNGKLIFVNSSNGLKHTIDDVQGEINSDGFNINYKNQKKKTYYWNLIEMPIKIIGNVEQCFLFLYKNSTQIFCDKNKLKTYSWINALTEGFMCYHFDIKGVVVNKNVELIDSTKGRKNSSDLLIVDLKPEENSTRVVVNKEEHKIGNNESISLRKIKKEMEEGRKISSGEILTESTEGLAKTNEKDNSKEALENEEEEETD